MLRYLDGCHCRTFKLAKVRAYVVDKKGYDNGLNPNGQADRNFWIFSFLNEFEDGG